MNDNRAATLEEALNLFIDMYLRGQQPDIDEFVRQYPQCEVQLKKRIQDLREIDTLFDTIFQADQSDFVDAVPERELVDKKMIPRRIAEKLQDRLKEKHVQINKDQLYLLVNKIKEAINNYNQPGTSEETSVFNEYAEIEQYLRRKGNFLAHHFKNAGKSRHHKNVHYGNNKTHYTHKNYRVNHGI